MHEIAPAHARAPRSPRAVPRARRAARPRLPGPQLHGRHRRPCRQRQDGAAAGPLPRAPRHAQPGRRHQRHLHARGRRVPRRGTRRSRDRIRAVETGGCPHAAIREDISHNLVALEELMEDVRPEPAARRERRRQPGRAVQPRARGLHDLRHRRVRRRQDPAQGRTRASRSPTCW